MKVKSHSFGKKLTVRKPLNTFESWEVCAVLALIVYSVCINSSYGLNIWEYMGMAFSIYMSGQN